MGEARALAEERYDAFNAGDFDGAFALYSDDVDGMVPGAEFTGPEAFNKFVHPFYVAFPDAKLHPQTYVESGDTVVVEGRFTGEHTGPLLSPDGNEIPPTGKTIDLKFVDVFRTAGGKIASHHVYFDRADFMGQLGLAPQP